MSYWQARRRPTIPVRKDTVCHEEDILRMDGKEILDKLLEIQALGVDLSDVEVCGGYECEPSLDWYQPVTDEMWEATLVKYQLALDDYLKWEEVNAPGLSPVRGSQAGVPSSESETRRWSAFDKPHRAPLSHPKLQGYLSPRKMRTSLRRA